MRIAEISEMMSLSVNLLSMNSWDLNSWSINHLRLNIQKHNIQEHNIWRVNIGTLLSPIQCIIQILATKLLSISDRSLFCSMVPTSIFRKLVKLPHTSEKLNFHLMIQISTSKLLSMLDRSLFHLTIFRELIKLLHTSEKLNFHLMLNRSFLYLMISTSIFRKQIKLLSAS